MNETTSYEYEKPFEKPLRYKQIHQSQHKTSTNEPNLAGTITSYTLLSKGSSHGLAGLSRYSGEGLFHPKKQREIEIATIMKIASLL